MPSSGGPVSEPSQEQLDRLRQAGSIAYSVLREAAAMVRPGMRALEICEYAETRIRELGANPAFPCNVGIDSVAAHYTATHTDNEEIPRNSLVKLDIGVELEGYIADTAITIDLRSQHGYLVDVAKEALRNALSIVKSGVKVSEIGKLVYETAIRLGCRPIANLSGHEIKRHCLHAGVSIPNIPTADTKKLEASHIYAIEPFITLSRASGVVVNTKTINIFSVRDTQLRVKGASQEEREVWREIIEVSRGLPYTTRWLSERAALLHPNLYRRGLVFGYPVLVEKGGAPVAQAEHTVIVYDDGCEILTTG
ncbi:MAG: type II methionyl aminopeptidase [Nitrososphaerota archaeon]